MRLQVLIERHSLPAVRILFNTGSGPSSQTAQDNSSIADLLNDLNKIIPLESSAGEWGLEDYVVEVAATADQEHKYECLHYSHIEDVLREDDEVVVRNLTGRELQERRLGGRFQISADGRHLTDGITWGRNWIRGDTSRPGVQIPSRKKRRLLVNEDDTAEVPMSLNEMALIEAGDSDTDEEDRDFDPVDDQPLQITATAEFYNDDESDDRSSDEDDGSSEVGSEVSDELKDLLKDAELELGQWQSDLQRLEEEEPRNPRTTKRKREVPDTGEEAHTDSNFEGFSSPAHRSGTILEAAAEMIEEAGTDSYSSSSSSEDSLLHKIQAEQRAKKRQNILPDASDESSTSSYEEDSESTSSSGSDEDHSSEPLEPLAVARIAERVISRTQDSSDSSDSATESNSSLTSHSGDWSLSDADLGASSDSSSSSSSPSHSDQSMSDRSSSSSGSSSDSSSESDSDAEIKLPDPSSKLLEPFKYPKGVPSQAIDEAESVQTIPGHGKSSTHQNNDRHRRRQQLNRLKAEGILPANADFAALKAYQATQNDFQSTTSQQDQDFPDIIEEKKAALLAQMTSSPHVADAPITEDTAKEPPESLIGAVRQDQEANKENIDDSLEQPGPTLMTEDLQQEIPSPTPKQRSKLDIASTRRMLFGSLGLKTPKTPAAEQELREKLAQDVRQPVSRKDEVLSAEQAQAHSPGADHDSWKSKLIVSAVECEVPNVQLKPPPFPFHQGWDQDAKAKMRRVDKKKARNDTQYYEDAEMEDIGYAPDVSNLDEAVDGVETPTLESTTISAELANCEDLPMPADFNILASLDSDDVNPGAVVAFKELYMTPSGQPEVSDYRVARVVAIDENGDVRYMLSQRDRDALHRAKYDPVTGEKKYSAFEIPNEEEEAGLPEELVLPFWQMLDSKLVERPKVQVTSSDASYREQAEEHIDSPREETAAIPDSNPVQAITTTSDVQIPETIVSQVNIDTPRREEIRSMIKDAGFDSAIDEDLLQPVPDVGSANKSASPGLHSSPGESPRLSARSSRHTSADPGEHSKRASFETSGFESPQYPGWSSFSVPGNHELPLETSSPAVDDGTQVANFNDDDQWVSTQESVKESGSMLKLSATEVVVNDITYPHMSQLELESQAHSSSHQDAQKVDQIDQEEPDITRLVDEPDPRPNDGPEDHALDDDDEHQESMRSEVPQSQHDLPESGQQQSPPPMDSFLGGQQDGRDSLGDDHPDSVDSDGLFSLRKILSSSQAPRSSATSPRSTRVSPPALRKGLRNGKTRKETRLSSEEQEHDTGPNIKISASQQYPTMSQIPDGTPVVDLTMSSDPVSPGGSDGEFFRPRTTRGRKKATDRVSKTKTSATQDSNVSVRGDSQELGLGKRKMLISRKARSQV